MGITLTIILFIVILGILVFVHELGHFFTARRFGVKCSEFGFGFPPRIGGWKKIKGKRKFFWGRGEVESEDTIYSLNWLPIGGFVNIKGENGEDAKDKDSFGSKKPWKRGIILSAGVIMNVVLCAVCLMVSFGLGAPQIVDDSEAGAVIVESRVQVISLVQGAPAQEAGIQLGDEIIDIDGHVFQTTQEISDYTASKEGEKMIVKVVRYTEPKEFEIEPEIIAATGRPGMGAALAKTGIVSYPWYQSIWLGIKATGIMFVQILVAFGTIIKNAVIGQPIGIDVAGPVGIAVMTGQVAKMGFVYILQFTALLSLNLAIINFLPFPALDGGRVLFLIIEKIRRKPVNQKVEQVMHTVGFFILIALVILVTGRDIWKFFR